MRGKERELILAPFYAGIGGTSNWEIEKPEQAGCSREDWAYISNWEIELEDGEAAYGGIMYYRTLNGYLRDTYGEKLYKLSLKGALTCPNRDGTLGERGCIFCSAGGSGEFAEVASHSVREQLEDAKKRVRGKFDGTGFIAYYQAFTNTYGDVEELEERFMETVAQPEVKVLSIATRPDCLGAGVLSVLDRLNRIKPVWVELGLQTIHEETAAYIRRGYCLPVFDEAVKALRNIGILVIVHLILGLPGETREMMLQTVDYISRRDVQGVKLQLLHVLKDTDLACAYRQGDFQVMTMEDYIALLGQCVERLREDIVIHRMTGDGDKRLLIAPLWSGDKKRVINAINRYFREQNICQGSKCRSSVVYLSDV